MAEVNEFDPMIAAAGKGTTTGILSPMERVVAPLPLPKRIKS
jgi:hypothetical protein